MIKKIIADANAHEARVAPVSYTHLDVYKRQTCVQSRCGFQDALLRSQMSGRMHTTLKSVSYTHLDVYKRQLCTYRNLRHQRGCAREQSVLHCRNVQHRRQRGKMCIRDRFWIRSTPKSRRKQTASNAENARTYVR